MPAKAGSGNRIKPRFLKGYVEMRYKPERALTHDTIVNSFSEWSVEMRYRPERALTLY